MNTFGVDDQPSGLTIWLCERGDGSVAMRPVATSETSADGDDEPWASTCRLLTEYLGRLPPTPASGHHVVVSVQGSANERAVVEKRCAAAGITSARALPASDALLCRWLTNRQLPPLAPIISVAIGEAVTMIAGYRVESRSGRPPNIERCGEAQCELGSGAWLKTVVSRIISRFPEVPPAPVVAAVRRAARDFAMQLARTADYEPAQWYGPGAGRLQTPFAVSPAESARWTEVTVLTDWLDREVSGLVNQLQGPSTPVVLVGGPGAAWPFARRALTAHREWQVSHSGSPADDLARGAARSPEVVLPEPAAAPSQTLIAPAAAGAPAPLPAVPAPPGPPTGGAGDGPLAPWLADELAP